MRRTRVIPVLLLRDGGLVKTVRFREPVYVGDPINTVKIFNDKEVDELAFLDIAATPSGRPPDFDLVAQVASEAFMPLAYGGGVRSVDDIRRITACGVEKVIINSRAAEDPGFVRDAAERFGSSTIVVSVDVRRDVVGRLRVYSHGGRRSTVRAAVEYAGEMERMGAGELLLTSIDRDGTGSGFDLGLVGEVAGAVNIPVIACGGASGVADFAEAVRVGASAVAAGSMFVFQGRHRAILVSFPTEAELRASLP